MSDLISNKLHTPTNIEQLQSTVSEYTTLFQGIDCTVAIPLTAADTIPSVSSTACTHKASNSVETVSVNVAVVHGIGLIAFINVFTGESISRVPSVTAAVIAPNVVSADAVHITLICSSFTLVNVCM